MVAIRGKSYSSRIWVSLYYAHEADAKRYRVRASLAHQTGTIRRSSKRERANRAAKITGIGRQGSIADIKFFSVLFSAGHPPISAHRRILTARAALGPGQ